MRTLPLVLLLVVACGGGGGDDDDSSAAGLSPVPSEWSTGDKLGYVLLSRSLRSVEDRNAGTCAVTAALAVATRDTELPAARVEGDCTLGGTALYSDSGRGALGLDPACAGAFTLAYGTESRRVTVCDPERFGAPLDIDCADVEGATEFRATSGPDELEGDVLGAFDQSADVPEPPHIDAPSLQGDATGQWSGGDLEVRWSGEASSSVELVMSAREGEGPVIRCRTADDGSFTIPASLTSDLAGTPVYLEVARNSVRTMSADGFSIRVGVRVSDFGYLDPVR